MRKSTSTTRSFFKIKVLLLDIGKRNKLAGPDSNSIQPLELFLIADKRLGQDLPDGELAWPGFVEAIGNSRASNLLSQSLLPWILLSEGLG